MKLLAQPLLLHSAASTDRLCLNFAISLTRQSGRIYSERNRRTSIHPSGPLHDKHATYSRHVQLHAAPTKHASHTPRVNSNTGVPHTHSQLSDQATSDARHTAELLSGHSRLWLSAAAQHNQAPRSAMPPPSSRAAAAAARQSIKGTRHVRVLSAAPEQHSANGSCNQQIQSLHFHA